MADVIVNDFTEGEHKVGKCGLPVNCENCGTPVNDLKKVMIPFAMVERFICRTCHDTYFG
jgi:hypothetical protein